ncbi:MAG: hypothetical protein OIN89_04710 [Candidatus Methanoperedens sp.]|jgi:hypothetical protein|nr:hypothetical protein [Candidatus Methanoperedens sp.]PKL52782.1 MAG: hypothetical protein CVV36_10620 [Candidatus Methanoperedenaceae archaeon HGW-Methanoperedenaceae-1]
MSGFKIILVTIIFIFTMPLAQAYQTSYNKENKPVFELNNTPLITNLEGCYLKSENSITCGRIIFYEDPQMTPVFPISGKVILGDINTNFTYVFFGRKGMPIDNRELNILKFTINYNIKNNVELIIPFSFDLGEWPLYMDIVDEGISVGIENISAGNSSLLIYGENKSILFSKLPYPFEYIVSKQNNSVVLSIIGRNVNKEGRLELELKVTEFTPLELLNVNLYKEKSVIFIENSDVKIKTDYYKDFDYPVSSMMYFDDPEKAEKQFNETSEVGVTFGVLANRSWNSTIIANDSEKLMLIKPFPNMVISSPDVGLYESENLNLFMANPRKVQYLNINNYENKIELLNIDRYIFTISYLKEPEISYLPNKTIIYWNYSDFKTPIASIGVVRNETQPSKLISSGNQILIVKPESRKYHSKELMELSPPVNENEAPNKVEIIRTDNREPLKPKIPIPLVLDTSSDTFIHNMKVDGIKLNGPWELKPDLSLEEGKYYSIKAPKNKLGILFIINKSDAINVELEYSQNISESIEKINSYTWNYSIYKFYPIGDISDYKQIYEVILPSQYSFIKMPHDAILQRTKDGREQIIIEYNQSVRYRYINFSIISENMKEEAEENTWGHRMSDFGSDVFNVFANWVGVGILSIIAILLEIKYGILRKIKERIKN